MALVACSRKRSSWLLIVIVVLVVLAFVAIATFATRGSYAAPRPPMHDQK